MKHEDLAALAGVIAPVIKDSVESAVAPIRARLEAIEGRAPERGEKGDPGDRGEPGEKGEPGEAADADAILERLIPEMEKAVAAMPPAEKGERGEPGEKGEPGKDADPEELRGMIADMIPEPVKGEKGDAGERGEPGEKGEPGKDGVGVTDAMLNRDGNLVLTLADGRTRDVGRVVGSDGKDGAPGRDGLGFDDMDVAYDGERSLTFRFQRGETVLERIFTLPVILYRGIFKDGESYAKGDSVTHAGSMWIALEDTGEKPGEASAAWKLSAKRGRDGRNGKDGEKGERGPQGLKGEVTRVNAPLTPNG